MISLTTGHLIQLLAALCGGVIAYISGYIFRPRILITFLFLLTPFQIINSRYGSVNMVLTYIIGTALLLQSKLIIGKLMPFMAIIFGSMAVSLLMAPIDNYFRHFIYLISFVSNYIVFYLGYTYSSRIEKEFDLFKIFIMVNILVNLYCVILFISGFNDVSFLGIQEFSLQGNRLSGRLVGPFNAAGITAEFLVIQIFILGYALIRYKYKSLWLLIFANLFFLLSTGNRGGVIILVLGMILFSFCFRREIGYLKVGLTFMGVVLAFAISSYLIINYSQFDAIFDRLTNTSFEGITPDTRVGLWPAVAEAIKEKLILGHGPRYWLSDQDGVGAWNAVPYAHNLYLHILYTTGVIGLLSFLLFFGALFAQFWKMSKVYHNNTIRMIGKLSLVLLLIFLVDQMKISFLRFSLVDYQHYMFFLWGSLVGFGDFFEEKDA